MTEHATPMPDHSAADTILIDSHIYTMEPRLSEVEALVIRDGRIIALGDDAQITSLE